MRTLFLINIIHIITANTPTYSPFYFPPITRRPTMTPWIQPTMTPSFQPSALLTKAPSLMPVTITASLNTSPSYVSLDIQYFIMSILGFYVLVIAVIVLRCAFFYVTEPQEIETETETETETDSFGKKERTYYIDVDLNDIQRKPRFRGLSFKPLKNSNGTFESSMGRISPTICNDTPSGCSISNNSARGSIVLPNLRRYKNRVFPLLPLHIKEIPPVPPIRVYSPPKCLQEKNEIPYNPNVFHPLLNDSAASEAEGSIVLPEERKKIDLSGINLSWLDDDEFTKKNGIHLHKHSLISKLFPSISSKSFFSSYSDEDSKSLYDNFSRKSLSVKNRTSSMMERFHCFTNPQTHSLLSIPKLKNRGVDEGT